MNILLLREDFNGNSSVPSNFMWDIEYSVIASDIIKSFDCNTVHSYGLQTQHYNGTTVKWLIFYSELSEHNGT